MENKNITRNNKNKLFYQCFSEKQKDFLVSKGHSILLTAKHVKTDNLFWCFVIDDKLNKDLSIWSNKDNLK